MYVTVFTGFTPFRHKFTPEMRKSCQSSSHHHSADGDPGPEGGGEHPRPDLPRAVAARNVVALVGAVAVLVALVPVAEAGVNLVLKVKIQNLLGDLLLMRCCMV